MSFAVILSLVYFPSLRGTHGPGLVGCYFIPIFLCALLVEISSSLLVPLVYRG